MQPTCLELNQLPQSWAFMGAYRMTEEEHDHAKVIGAAISQEQATHWSWDKRVPIFSVVALAFAGIVSVASMLIVVGSMKQTFTDEIERVATHETRLIALESGLVKTNLDVSDMRGDIKEVLALLRQPDRRFSPH